MSIQELLEQFDAQVAIINKDRATVETNKAAGARIRKATLELAKIGKALRAATLAK